MHKNLGSWIIIAILFGIIAGIYLPDISKNFKIMSDIFIRLIGMAVGPIIFCSLVCGFMKHKSIKNIGKIVLYAILYFEIISTIALLIGLIVSNIFKPGAGIYAQHLNILYSSHIVPKSHLNFREFIINIFPNSSLDAFAKNNIMQILFFSIIFACAAFKLGEKNQILISLIQQIRDVFFNMLNYILFLAPLAAFGSIAYTVSTFGTHILQNFAELIFVVYGSVLFFIILILGSVCYVSGFSLYGLLQYLKDEILLALGTSSSEAVLPQLINKLEQYSCDPGIVGLIVPSGYSLNLDGTAIYLSAATIFIAQAYGVDLSISQQAFIMLILMINSKGSAAIAGGGFITLSATLFAIDLLPTEGLSLLIAIDRLISPARSVTNIIGNSVATVVMSRLYLTKNK